MFGIDARSRLVRKETSPAHLENQTCNRAKNFALSRPQTGTRETAEVTGQPPSGALPGHYAGNRPSACRLRTDDYRRVGGKQLRAGRWPVLSPLAGSQKPFRLSLDGAEY